jgi:transposase
MEVMGQRERRSHRVLLSYGRSVPVVDLEVHAAGGVNDGPGRSRTAPGFPGLHSLRRRESKAGSLRVRERAVGWYSAPSACEWAAITSIAEKIGCAAETLRSWVRRAERDAGQRPGLTTDERVRLKQLERENFELRRANEILKKASAYFAQAELDRRAK